MVNSKIIKIGEKIQYGNIEYYISDFISDKVILKTRQELENDSCCVNCKWFKKSLGYKNGSDEIYYFCGLGGWKMSSNPTVLKEKCKEYNLEVKPTKTVNEERYEWAIERIRKEK